MAKELIEGKRKDPYTEPDIKDYGTRVETVVEEEESVAIADDASTQSSQSTQSRRRAATTTESATARPRQTIVTYSLDDNQKLRLRREHGKIQELEKNDDDDRKESLDPPVFKPRNVVVMVTSSKLLSSKSICRMLSAFPIRMLATNLLTPLMSLLI